MRALVVYESMYGNTHLIADAIGEGLADSMEVAVVPVGDATAERLDGIDVLVVGGPTHAHGMSREATREGAVADAQKEGSTLHLDPDAEGEGLREWFDELPELHAAAAAFDTRFEMPAALTGRASKGISKRLRKHGCGELVEPESFFVERDNTLEPGERTRARAWGEEIARTLSTRAASAT